MTFGIGCILEDCERKHHARGFCLRHYAEVQRRGYLSKPCTIDGCERRHKAGGYCRMHYDRWRFSRPMEPDATDPIEWDVVRDYIECGYSAPIIAKRLHISESRLFSLIQENEPALRRRIGVAA